MRRFAIVCSMLVAACAPRGDERISLSAPERLSAATKVGAAPMFAVSPTGARAVAWVSAPDGGTDGRLYVRTAGDVVELRDPLGPIEPHGEAPPKIAFAPDGSLYALYAVAKIVPGRRFPFTTLRLARSADGGATWGEPLAVAPDSSNPSRNFHALHAVADGTLYVAWLQSGKNGSATYLTHSRDGGATWSAPTRVAAAESCPCCRTAIATGANGELYVAWRQVFAGNVRDVVVARSDDRGTTWTEPVRVHADDWVFEGCPHAGPSMQVDRAGRLHVSWWTGKPGAAGVYYARSDDGARSFGAPVALGVADFSRPAHVQLALAGDSSVAVAWDDGTTTVPRVLLRVSENAGRSFGAAVQVSAEGSAATFPVLAATRGRVTVAWSEKAGADHVHEQHAKATADPKAPKGLLAVGASGIVVRTAALD